MIDLNGKVALVTGASRGIGRAIALRLGTLGADVAVTATSAQNVEQTVAEITAMERRSTGSALNVADYSEVETFVKSTIDHFGKIDILVNNAGITRDNLLVRMSQEEWRQVIDVNLHGVFNTIRAMTRAFMKQRSGKIINITSVVGLTGNAGQANYSAAKAGIIGLTKSVAKELAARNVQVNAVAPGFIETDMTASLSDEVKETMKDAIPLGRIGVAEDIAGVVGFLCSDAADYITGQTLNVDGGMVM